MTELKCPICDKPMKQATYDYDKKDNDDTLYMSIMPCDCVCNFAASKAVWEAFADTKKKLDRAIRVIQEVSKMSDKLSRKYGDTLVEQLDTIQAFCWEQGYILTHDEDFKRVEQIKDNDKDVK